MSMDVKRMEDEMKSKWFTRGTVCIILVFGVFVAGCASSAPYTAFESAPMDASSTIRIMMCEVTQFDGENTDAHWRANMGAKEVLIPSGNHALTLVARDATGSETIKTSYDFKPGRKYWVEGILDRAARRYTTRIFDITYTDDNLTPNALNDTASPFEGAWASKAKKTKYIFSGDQWMQETLDGKKSLRGVFSYSDTGLSMVVAAIYSSNKWKLMGSSTLKIDFKYDFTDGNLVLDKVVMTKQ
jgi:hypothetical protein